MSTITLLKEEVNKTLESLHDFAKWKLIAVSTLVAAGIGLQPFNEQRTTVWLLLFVPYACAYIDLNCYQYLLRIFLIAKVLRRSNDELLCEYEKQCEFYRRRGFFGLGLFAQMGCSLVFSIVTPGLAFLRFVADEPDKWKLVAASFAWVFGLGSITCFYAS
jgi:hypothetical protein